MDIVEGTVFLTSKEERIFYALLPLATDMKLEIVRVRFGTGFGINGNLQILVDCIDRRFDEPSITLSKCGDFSRAVVRWRDDAAEASNIVSKNCRLEISTPGIQRPLTRLKDFEKARDMMVAITIGDAVLKDARSCVESQQDASSVKKRKIKGRVMHVDIEKKIVTLVTENSEVEQLEFLCITQAKILEHSDKLTAKLFSGKKSVENKRSRRHKL